MVGTLQELGQPLQNMMQYAHDAAAFMQGVHLSLLAGVNEKNLPRHLSQVKRRISYSFYMMNGLTRTSSPTWSLAGSWRSVHQIFAQLRM